MATVTFIRYEKQFAGALHGVAQYVSQREKTVENGRWLVDGQNCVPRLAAQEFTATRQMHRKDRRVHPGDGAAGVSSAVGGEPKSHHLHHTKGNEVPG